MPIFPSRLRAKVARFVLNLTENVEHMRGHNRFVKADFDDGGKTLHSYLTTHRNKYYRHVGAHFLVQLYEAGPDVFENFAEKQRSNGWHFDLTHEENEALKRARDITCTHTRIANLRYSTNVFEQITNQKQLLRMLGLGAVAGSAGIVLGLGEMFFFFKESARKMADRVLGIDINNLGGAANENAAFVSLAHQVTEGAVLPDGTLDADKVSSGIANLVRTLEDAGSVETAVNALNGNTTYIVGILTGIVFLVVGRGLVQLILEGLNGAMSKIDALICDMDDYANWRLGRSPFPPTSKTLPGDLIIPDRSMLLNPKDFPSSFRAPQHRI